MEWSWFLIRQKTEDQRFVSLASAVSHHLCSPLSKFSAVTCVLSSVFCLQVFCLLLFHRRQFLVTKHLGRGIAEGIDETLPFVAFRGGGRLRELGGATAVGPVIMGLRRPVNVLALGANVSDIVNMAALTVHQALELEARGASHG